VLRQAARSLLRMRVRACVDERAYGSGCVALSVLAAGSCLCNFDGQVGTVVQRGGSVALAAQQGVPVWEASLLCSCCC
jgi:hypothetical protein